MNTSRYQRWYTVYDHEIALEVRQCGRGFNVRLPGYEDEAWYASTLPEAFATGWDRIQRREPNGVDQYA